MTPETEALLDKIAKLQAKAKSTSNEAEAELFAAKVAELLAKHNLDEAMLRARDAEREQGEIGEHPFGLRVPDAWRERIVVGVARVYFCTCIYSKRGGKVDQRSYRFVGREHNAIVAKAMAEYLIATVKRMAREYSGDRLLQNNYRKGAGDRLFNRLEEMAKALRADQPKGGDGTALVVRSEDIAIREYLGDVPSSKGRAHKHGHGSQAGWNDAGDISLNMQIKETRASRLLA